MVLFLPLSAGWKAGTIAALLVAGETAFWLAAGASDYVTKPVDLDELLGTIASWVAQADGRAGAADEEEGR